MSNELQYFGYQEIEEDLIDQDFIEAMRENMRMGIKNGRKAGDWKERDEEGVEDRFEAIDRHGEKFESTLDPRHLAAIACNALIVWWHEVKKGK